MHFLLSFSEIKLIKLMKSENEFYCKFRSKIGLGNVRQKILFTYTRAVEVITTYISNFRVLQEIFKKTQNNKQNFGSVQNMASK